MADINRVLYTAKEAILSNLTAINVTSGNISNVNTAGYSRLRPIFESVGANTAISTQEQIGVRIADVERIYDRFLELQLVQQNSMVANYTAQQDLLQRVEGVLNESIQGGISDALGAFFNAWGDLSVDPSSKAKRDAVISAAENLSYIFNQRSQELGDIQTSADDSVKDTVDILNGYLTQIAHFNELIVNAQSVGASASAVRDQRISLLNDISKIIDINYLEREDGSLYIYLPQNGQALVEGINIWELDVQINPANNNFYDVVFKDSPTVPINNQIDGGKLAGLIEVRDTAIDSYLNSLNQTASSLINRVNTLHQSGYDQDNNPGELFFTATVGNEAATMSVNTNIIANTRLIAASATINADGNNAAAITAVKNELFAALGNITIDGYFNAFIANMGQDVVNVSQMLKRETVILNQQTDQREQLSGVSLDEEMLNLIKYQMAYNAAGRVTKAVSEMMDIIINLGQ